ncbi:MAG: VWA domain-containing protein [Acidobacteriota bacterium]|nr:VWA domain-containing protein [Acidobacteriota bacterium]
MPYRRIVLTAFLCWAAQAQQSSQQTAPEAVDTPIERTTVNFVLAPVTVKDGAGSIVNGLQPAQFKLFDNGKEQDIRVDVAFQPISMVIAIEASDRVDAILTQIHKIGPLIEPLVIGDQGEAAVLAFDHRLQELQGFTNDATKIEKAVQKIHAGSTSSRMIDAVDRAVFMLRSRPPNRRRIVMLISETRDKASEGKIKDALIDAQLSNVSVYAIDISQIARRLTEKAQPPRPDPFPPAARNLPGGQPSTPTTVQHATGLGSRIEFVPMLVEIYKDTKGIFVDNPVEVFTKGTGASEFSFIQQRGLEKAIQSISQEVHSQYLISYNPNNKSEGGFHEITVQLDRRDLKVQTRPGYWLASLKQ